MTLSPQNSGWLIGENQLSLVSILSVFNFICQSDIDTELKIAEGIYFPVSVLFAFCFFSIPCGVFSASRSASDPIPHSERVYQNQLNSSFLKISRKY